jgi:GTP-binding protein EngB required for normal cell division
LALLLSPSGREQVDVIHAKLTGPLHIALAGRVGAGKSTVVNAMAGALHAPTGVSGSTKEIGVYRRNDWAIIDTPGLQSHDQDQNRRVWDYLTRLDPAAEGAQVHTPEIMVYLYVGTVKADDLETLDTIRSLAGVRGTSPLNSIACLNKVDKLEADPAADPWPTARRLALRHGADLGPFSSVVHPLVGRLAETCLAGLLSNDDFAALKALASLPADDLALLLLDGEAFVAGESPIAGEHRQRLLGLLDLYGIAVAVRESSTASGPLDLMEQLLAHSGWPALRAHLEHVIRDRIGPIKADAALASLERLAAGTAHLPDRELLNSALQRLTSQPRCWQLLLLDAVRRGVSGAVELPEDLAAELIRIATLKSPEELDPAAGMAEAALQTVHRWKSFADHASPAQRRVANSVVDAMTGLYLLARGG